MGFTNPEFPVMVLTICIDNRTNLTAGDIISARRWGIGPRFGLLTLQDCLFIPVEGLEYNEYARLTDPVMVDEQDIPNVEFPTILKRRFCVPLSRLEEVVPGFQRIKAANKHIPYQPFLMTNHGGFLAHQDKIVVRDASSGGFEVLGGGDTPRQFQTLKDAWAEKSRRLQEVIQIEESAGMWLEKNPLILDAEEIIWDKLRSDWLDATVLSEGVI